MGTFHAMRVTSHLTMLELVPGIIFSLSILLEMSDYFKVIVSLKLGSAFPQIAVSFSSEFKKM